MYTRATLGLLYQYCSSSVHLNFKFIFIMLANDSGTEMLVNFSIAF